MRSRAPLVGVALSVMYVLGGSVAVLADDVKVVKNHGIEGVIADAATARKWGAKPEKAQGFWTPTPEDIAAVESRLHVALEKGAKDPATIMPGPFSAFSRQQSSGEIERILGSYGKYRRQYLGVVIGGKRYVYLNSFPADMPMHEKDEFVEVMDGGTNFWRVLYCVETGVFSRLSANGYA